MNRRAFLHRTGWLAAGLAGTNAAWAAASPATFGGPPPPLREFRGTWIATVGNSCWPSKPGLTTGQQQAELLALLDRAAAVRLNAVIFQVRPACDTFYPSELEPWSEYLTGIMGRAPQPYYDPLAFALHAAHSRGLELHAWFNPFRARNVQAISGPAPNHISRTRPQWVRSYGRYLWLDPGDPDVRAHSLQVVLDVARRYDVDGIHFDDYFYPYRENGRDGHSLDFPDETTWQRYGAGTKLTREDWRRHNVDQFIQQVYAGLRAVKPGVKFGISPFGIWRPKNPPAVTGLDAYNVLYADARKWLHAGWCDYLSPQLYWATTSTTQNFTALYNWWRGENPQQRHVWPGMDGLKTTEGWPISEILAEINVTRHSPDPGQVHWSIAALMKNGALASALANGPYRDLALVPGSPWLDAAAPAQPELTVHKTGGGVEATWSARTGALPRWWLFQWRMGGAWNARLLPANEPGVRLDSPHPQALAVRAVSATGITGPTALWTGA